MVMVTQIRQRILLVYVGIRYIWIDRVRCAISFNEIKQAIDNIDFAKPYQSPEIPLANPMLIRNVGTYI